MKGNRKTVHEIFHSSTKPHQSIIRKNNFTYRNIIKVVDSFVPFESSVLDIGCGSGTVSLYLASTGNKVDGIDISEKAIRECQKSATNLKLESFTNFSTLDFPNKIPNQKYNAIIMFEVIEHLENDTKALATAYKLLNKGGVLIISTPSLNAPLHRLGVTKEFDKKVGHLRRYTLENLIRKSENAGFTVIKAYGTEGILRNFLFLNPLAGKSIRFIKYFLSDVVSFIDDLTALAFGESDLFIILRK